MGLFHCCAGVGMRVANKLVGRRGAGNYCSGVFVRHALQLAGLACSGGHWTWDLRICDCLDSTFDCPNHSAKLRFCWGQLLDGLETIRWIPGDGRFGVVAGSTIGTMESAGGHAVPAVDRRGFRRGFNFSILASRLLLSAAAGSVSLGNGTVPTGRPSAVAGRNSYSRCASDCGRSTGHTGCQWH